MAAMAVVTTMVMVMVMVTAHADPCRVPSMRHATRRPTWSMRCCCVCFARVRAARGGGVAGVAPPPPRYCFSRWHFPQPELGSSKTTPTAAVADDGASAADGSSSQSDGDSEASAPDGTEGNGAPSWLRLEHRLRLALLTRAAASSTAYYWCLVPQGMVMNTAWADTVSVARQKQKHIASLTDTCPPPLSFPPTRSTPISIAWLLLLSSRPSICPHPGRLLLMVSMGKLIPAAPPPMQPAPPMMQVAV